MQRTLYPSARSANFGRAAVAASEPVAASAGLMMLARGGTAVDAAIAAAATLTVTEPVSNGLGSDAFALVSDGGPVAGLNASGRSPAGWTPERFAGVDAMPRRGWDTITIPGAVSAWVALHERYGRLPFSEVLAPAIRAAREGYGVGPVTAASWQRQLPMMTGKPGWDAAFAPNGRAPEAGERFVFPGAAAALELIGETEGEAFYKGDIAAAIVAASQAGGGAHTMEDFAAHTADWVTPVTQRCGALTVHEIPPNGQGIAALIALGILERIDLGDEPDSPHSIHMQIEAVKLALADSYTHVADIDAMVIRPEDLLEPAYLDARAALIDPTRAQTFDTGKPLQGGTVILCAADEQGMMISFIQSNYEGFGSGCVEPNFGISLQNRGSGFSLSPESPNRVGPKKRPFHTIIPAFATEGDTPVMAFGLMGGPIQAQGHTQMMIRMERFGQGVQTAIDAPRFRTLEGLEVAVETHFQPATIEGLAERGHLLKPEAPNVAFGFGGAQAIRKVGDLYAAGSDPRKDGHAVVL